MNLASFKSQNLNKHWSASPTLNWGPTKNDLLSTLLHCLKRETHNTTQHNRHNRLSTSGSREMERSAVLGGLQPNYLLCPSRRYSSTPLPSLSFADKTLSPLKVPFSFSFPLQFPRFREEKKQLLINLIHCQNNFFCLFIYCFAAPEANSACFSQRSSGFSLEAWCRFIWYIQLCVMLFIIILLFF